MYLIIDLGLDFYFSKNFTNTMQTQSKNGLLHIIDISDKENPKEFTGNDPEDPTSWTDIEDWNIE
jgi:hypothetical protein